MIDSAVEELQSMAKAGDRFWTQVMILRNGTRGRGQWAMVPKPDFGRVMAQGERAKDVIIPYAVDEGMMELPCLRLADPLIAPSALRARCLAAFDLDLRKMDSLTFGAREYCRLRVTYSDGISSSSSSLVAAAHEHGSDFSGMMEAAQLEAFDEDLLNEVTAPAVF